MILRLIGLMVSGGLAYAMLRGWPAVLPELPRACLAVLLLLGGLSLWALGRKSDDLPLAKGTRSPGWLDFASIGLGLLALECGFLWILSAAPAPLEEIAIRVEERFRPEAAGERLESGGDQPVSGNWLWQDERRRALPMRTNLKPGPKPEVFVRLANGEDAGRLLEEQVYVRAFALDRFEDGVWSASGSEVEVFEAATDGWIRFAEESENEILHEVFHGKDPGGRDVFTALQGARAVRLRSLQSSGDGTWFLPDASGPAGYEYLASSAPVTLKDLVGKQIDHDGEVPKDSDSRIRRLALKAAGEGSLVERLRNIETFLRDNYGYSLITENPRNLDPLENFLFAEKRGHCEFFATAGALMARELGTEVRVAYGWAGGQFFKENHMFVFRAREAHAWVEVNLGEHGWVLMEPTAPVVLGGGGTPRVAGSGDAFPSPEETLIENEESYGSQSGDVATMALVLTGAFAGAAVWMFLLREKSRTADGGRRIIGGKRSVGYFGAWRRASEKRGLKAAGKTLKSQIGGLDQAPGFADDLLLYHYGVRYEGKEIDVDREKLIEKQIREWEP